MADDVFEFLKEANKNNSIEEFRRDFTSAHTPLLKFFQSKGKNIEQLQFIEEVEIGPQSAYPHYCLFSADDKQLITNSSHFYNGLTIGVATDAMNGLKIEAYEGIDAYAIIDDEMRVYAGLTTKDLYIPGDAHGYIKALDKEGKCLWRYFLGSTIGGLAISDDEETV